MSSVLVEAYINIVHEAEISIENSWDEEFIAEQRAIIRRHANKLASLYTGMAEDAMKDYDLEAYEVYQEDALNWALVAIS